MFVALLVVLMAAAMGTASAADTFLIHGDVDGLYPGFDGILQAQVVNTLDVSIHVHEVSATPTAVNAAGCGLSLVHITSRDTALDLSPGQTALVPLHVRMSATTPDACQGAMFELTFRGTSLAQDRPPSSLAFTGGRTTLLVVSGLTMFVIGCIFVRRTRPGPLS
jgi:hypothetical protein